MVIVTVDGIGVVSSDDEASVVVGIFEVVDVVVLVVDLVDVVVVVVVIVTVVDVEEE